METENTESHSLTSTASRTALPTTTTESFVFPNASVNSTNSIISPNSAVNSVSSTCVNISSKNEKGLPKAMVKPNVLTHVIEGFVIQESQEPFPVNRQRYSDRDEQDDEPPSSKLHFNLSMKCI